MIFFSNILSVPEPFLEPISMHRKNVKHSLCHRRLELRGRRYNNGYFAKVTWLCPRRIESFLFRPRHVRETDANSRAPLLSGFFVTDTKGNRIKYSIHLVRNQDGKAGDIATTIYRSWINCLCLMFFFRSDFFVTRI